MQDPVRGDDDEEVGTPTPSRPPTVPPMAGYLYKQGGAVKTWKKRWFKVENGCIKYQKHSASRACKGAVPFGTVREIYLTDNLMKQRKYDNCCFAIACGYRTYACVASTPAEAKRWIRYLQAEWRDEVMQHSPQRIAQIPDYPTPSTHPDYDSSSGPSTPYTPIGSAMPSGVPRSPRRSTPTSPELHQPSFLDRLQAPADAREEAERATANWLGGLESHEPASRSSSPSRQHLVQEPQTGPLPDASSRHALNSQHESFSFEMNHAEHPSHSPRSARYASQRATLPAPRSGMEGGALRARSPNNNARVGRVWRLAAQLRARQLEAEQHQHMTESLANELLEVTALLEGSTNQCKTLKDENAQLQLALSSMENQMALLTTELGRSRETSKHIPSSNGHHLPPSASPGFVQQDSRSAPNNPWCASPSCYDEWPLWNSSGPGWQGNSERGSVAYNTQGDRQKTRFPVYENCASSGFCLVGELVVCQLDTVDDLRRRVISELETGPRFTLAVDGKIYRDRQGGLMVRDIMAPHSAHSLVITRY